MDTMAYPPYEQQEAAKYRRFFFYWWHSLWTVPMNLGCSEEFDERQSRPSLKKLFARISDVIPHWGIVTRRRESRARALPVPLTSVLAMER